MKTPELGELRRWLSESVYLHEQEDMNGIPRIHVKGFGVAAHTYYHRTEGWGIGTGG